MFSLFECKHPAALLAMQKEQTLAQFDADFNMATAHLVCRNCQARIQIKALVLRGTADEFFAGGDPKAQQKEKA